MAPVFGAGGEAGSWAMLTEADLQLDLEELSAISASGLDDLPSSDSPTSSKENQAELERRRAGAAVAYVAEKGIKEAKERVGRSLFRQDAVWLYLAQKLLGAMRASSSSTSSTKKENEDQDVAEPERQTIIEKLAQQVLATESLPMPQGDESELWSFSNAASGEGSSPQDDDGWMDDDFNGGLGGDHDGMVGSTSSKGFLDWFAKASRGQRVFRLDARTPAVKNQMAATLSGQTSFSNEKLWYPITKVEGDGVYPTTSAQARDVEAPTSSSGTSSSAENRHSDGIENVQVDEQTQQICKQLGASDKQNQKDLQRDTLQVNGRTFCSAQYAKIVDFVKSEILLAEQVGVSQTGGGATSSYSSLRLANHVLPGPQAAGTSIDASTLVAKQLLSRVNRTYSGGLAFEQVLEHFGQANGVLVAPDSASAQPLELFCARNVAVGRAHTRYRLLLEDLSEGTKSLGWIDAHFVFVAKYGINIRKSSEQAKNPEESPNQKKQEDDDPWGDFAMDDDPPHCVQHVDVSSPTPEKNAQPQEEFEIEIVRETLYLECSAPDTV
ncbi:unnamed protein product [Amoebophrya sp. A25]|nr:unnamed protein product [Amoebophrya sp. A25]|eukprot:GSA25T00004790001.1